MIWFWPYHIDYILTWFWFHSCQSMFISHWFRCFLFLYKMVSISFRICNLNNGFLLLRRVWTWNCLYLWNCLSIDKDLWLRKWICQSNSLCCIKDWRSGSSCLRCKGPRAEAGLDWESNIDCNWEQVLEARNSSWDLVRLYLENCKGAFRSAEHTPGSCDSSTNWSKSGSGLWYSSNSGILLLLLTEWSKS